MPVYLCQSGAGETEPWRYGIQVYGAPFFYVTTTTTTAQHPPPIRRIRHAEIVLVDDVCIAHERYWLRLRWPGHKGGFAGYIAMGLVSEQPKGKSS
jgi:hypothetical protein